MTLRLIKFTRPYGPLFPGEIGGYPEPKASELLACKPPYGVEVDEHGNEIGGGGDFGSMALVPGGDDDGDGGDGEWKFDARTDPFVTDGISKQASQALHARGLHTVSAVRLFIGSVPEGVSPVDYVNEIDGVTDAQAEKLSSCTA